MENDILKVFFILWGIVLFIELLWFSSLNHTPHDTSDIAFAVTVIAVTSVFGSTGMFLFKKSRE